MKLRLRRASGPLQGLIIAAAAGFALMAQPAPARVHGSHTLTVYLVRHGERAGSSDEAPLNPSGREHARILARLLRGRGVTRVLTSSIPRCRQTAAPLVMQIRKRHPGFRPGVLPSDSPKQVETAIEALSNRDTVLVVGRSSFIPEVVRDLTGKEVSAERDEYYRIYELVRRPGSRVRFTLRAAPEWVGK